MSQKKETGILLLAILINAGIIVAILLLGKQFGLLNLGNLQSNRSIPNQSKTFIEVENVPSGLFNYGGSTTWAPIRKEVDLSIQKIFPEFQLRYTNPITGAPGSGTGIKMLLDKQLSFAHSSRPLKDEEYQIAKQKGFTLQEIPVAIDGIAIAVNPNLKVKGVTIAQLKDIYTGKITNWNQLGGLSLPIIPFSRRREDAGTVEFFTENILQGKNFGSNVRFIPTTTEALRKVSRDTGAIYYGSAPEVVPQCSVKTLPIETNSARFVPPYQEPLIPESQCLAQPNQLNKTAFQTGDYPITRRLFVIVRQDGQIDEKAGLAYANLLLSDRGQELIGKAGFVPIR